MSRYSKSIAFILALSLSLLIPGLAGANSYTLYPVADAPVLYGHNGITADTNYGDVIFLWDQYTDFYGPARSYLKFDLSSIPSGEVVTSATLNGYVIGLLFYQPDTGVIVNLHYVADDSWTETGITWNHKPDYNSTIMSQQNISALGWAQWNVDPGVMTDNFLSLLMKTNETSGKYLGADICSKEYATYPGRTPYLLVNTTAVVPLPPSVLLLGSGLLGLGAVGWRKRRQG